jgi:hypothetical protein
VGGRQGHGTVVSWGRPRSCDCGECKKCKQADYMRDWYGSKSLEERRAMREQRDMDRVRAADRERYHRMKEDPRFKARRDAVTTVNNAVRDGRLDRQPCEACGAEPAQGHHDDYSKPLEVRWLCPPCHANEHRKAA